MVSLVAPGDVSKLCALEDEFIEDHRRMLGRDHEEDFFHEVGLSPDPASRQKIIESINRQRPAYMRRDWTIKCVYVNPSSETQPSLVGYVYFRLRRREEDDAGEEDGSEWCISVSHIKVAHKHQKQGVATLLLAGALGQAQRAARGKQVCELRLSV